MSERLTGRVAIITGAGRGLGRAHALYLASQGASVVVNDLGGAISGDGSDERPATDVVNEINALGGHSVASFHDVSDWAAAAELIETAVDTFGDLHVLVNNAGILRDRTLANMTEAEWDAVIRVHLKGHAAPTCHAMAYWRNLAKSGKPTRASLIHTTSIAPFGGSFGQANYAAAKSGIVGLSRVAAMEGARYGVRSNAVSPSARTRIAMASAGAEEMFKPPAKPADFDALDPSNVSPLVGWLAEADCPANGQVFHAYGGRLEVIAQAPIVHDLTINRRWTPVDFDERLTSRLIRPPELSDYTDLIEAKSENEAPPRESLMGG